MKILSKIRKNKAVICVGYFLEFIVIIVLIYISFFRVVPVPLTPMMVYRPHEIKHDWVSIKNISLSLVKIAVTSEDPNFFEHHGFDFKALQNALKHNISGKKRVIGGSTISQQTAKNIFLWDSRSYLRKGLEFPLTAVMELFWTKKRIIEVYLNSIEMGKGIYGCEAAADYYFKTTAAKLSPAQSAALVVIFPGPLFRNPLKLNPVLQRKKSRIIKWSRGVELPENFIAKKKNAG